MPPLTERVPQPPDSPPPAAGTNSPRRGSTSGVTILPVEIDVVEAESELSLPSSEVPQLPTFDECFAQRGSPSLRASPAPSPRLERARRELQAKHEATLQEEEAIRYMRAIKASLDTAIPYTPTTTSRGHARTHELPS